MAWLRRIAEGHLRRSAGDVCQPRLDDQRFLS
jgi:hypothetical protein